MGIPAVRGNGHTQEVEIQRVEKDKLDSVILQKYLPLKKSLIHVPHQRASICLSFPTERLRSTY